MNVLQLKCTTMSWEDEHTRQSATGGVDSSPPPSNVLPEISGVRSHRIAITPIDAQLTVERTTTPAATQQGMLRAIPSTHQSTTTSMQVKPGFCLLALSVRVTWLAQRIIRVSGKNLEI